jgi:hypothetical protein
MIKYLKKKDNFIIIKDFEGFPRAESKKPLLVAIGLYR